MSDESASPAAATPLSGEVGPIEPRALLASPPIDDPKIALALTIYKGLGRDRSLAELAEKTGLHASVLGRWKSRYGWEAAAAQYDLELAQQALEDDKLRTIETWRKRKDDQLRTALLLRKKAWDYLIDREMEGVERHGKTIVKGIDPFKGQLALSFIKEANAIERAVLGVAEHITLSLSNGVESLTPEAIAAQIQEAMARRAEWRAENDLPALPEDGGESNPLGSYLV